MRLVNRFEALGAPQELILHYKKAPYYFLQQSSDAPLEPKEYAQLFKLGYQKYYEGEVDKAGKPLGKGIKITETDDCF